MVQRATRRTSGVRTASAFSPGARSSGNAAPFSSPKPSTFAAAATGDGGSPLVDEVLPIAFWSSSASLRSAAICIVSSYPCAIMRASPSSSTSRHGAAFALPRLEGMTEFSLTAKLGSRECPGAPPKTSMLGTKLGSHEGAPPNTSMSGGSAKLGSRGFPGGSDFPVTLPKTSMGSLPIMAPTQQQRLPR